MNMIYGALRHAGFVAFYWFSTSQQRTFHAYNLRLDKASVLPAYYEVRWNGFTVRRIM